MFQLVHSLEKSEKRHFKLYIKRSSAKEDLKIVQLFDALDKMHDYDEKVLLKKLPGTEKPQLSNLKTHLYREVLASLRLLKSTGNVDLELNEQLDYARILYYKGLYNQSQKILDKVKELAHEYSQDTVLMQVISLEKKIEILHSTRGMQDRTERLMAEANEVHERRQVITQLSNLALQMYSWFVKNGHARNQKDEAGVTQYFQEHFPKDADRHNGFYEKLYLYQSYFWFAFIRQDYLNSYRYAQKWTDLFREKPVMVDMEAGHYIKGMHNLLNAHFNLRNYRGFETVLKEFEGFAESDLIRHHDNFRVQTFEYIQSAKLKLHFMLGTFKEGVKLVPSIEEQLQEHSMFLDKHRLLVFNYKIATLYFGSGDYDTAIDYLQRIINENVEMRNDLQCYARLLHLMSHYELGNDSIMESLIKSVYRFMAKMEKLTIVEEEIFRFVRSTFHLSRHKLQHEFEQFLQKIKQLNTNRYEARSFGYLDIISWVESKVLKKPMSQVIQEKYLQSRRKLETGPKPAPAPLLAK
ncbi:hypothetical protein V9K67_22910 [Paraflavisolibacter sp. H34]|uniref:hypothetical protein n=1 Tax=Huijunlia imazamoxiresistens TaxID=3127457 RepID=UPI003018382B